MRVAPALLIVVALAAPSFAQETSSEDVVPGVPFQEGDVITYEVMDKLKEYLPPEFWENREYFFYEGMELEIGPFFREYEGNEVYEAATRKYAGQSRIGKDGAIENYTAGRPFTTEEIDCKGDPNAGVKIIWNFAKTWNGSGHKAVWSYTYWDRGEQLPLYYEGQARGIRMMNLPEAHYDDSGHNIFANEKRGMITGVEVVEPFDARGIMILSYRYISADGPLDQAKNDDTWVYLPDLRRVRRISTRSRAPTSPRTTCAASRAFRRSTPGSASASRRCWGR
jgi:hypothetical protein